MLLRNLKNLYSMSTYWIFIKLSSSYHIPAIAVRMEFSEEERRKELAMSVTTAEPPSTEADRDPKIATPASIALY